MTSRQPSEVPAVVIRSLSFAAALALGSVPLFAAPARYSLDPEHTTVAFLVEHVGYARTLGRFTDASGSFVWDPDTRELDDVRIVVATASVTTDHERRDEHVRSDDFLDVKEHPEMIFETTAPLVVEGNTARVEGRLTLRGETRPLALDVALNKAGKYPFGHARETLGVSARGALRRSDHGMEYAVANGLVGDEVELIIEFEALRD